MVNVYMPDGDGKYKTEALKRGVKGFINIDPGYERRMGYLKGSVRTQILDIAKEDPSSLVFVVDSDYNWAGMVSDDIRFMTAKMVIEANSLEGALATCSLFRGGIGEKALMFLNLSTEARKRRVSIPRKLTLLH